MVSRDDTHRRVKHDKQENTARFRHFGPETRTLAASASRSREKNLQDELIVSLSNAYENKRARQVTEWEMRQSVQRAF